jgi:flagellar basal-body rod protein FlgG
VEREGTVRYTRAGTFQVSADGRLVTADGAWQLLGAGGGPLRVANADFAVGRDGTVTDPRTGEEFGTVRVVSFGRPHLLEKRGQTLFAAPEAAGPVQAAGAEAGVEQHALEMSGTNGAEAMVRLIEAQRAYDANLQMLRAQDQMLGRAATEIARLGG